MAMVNTLAKDSRWLQLEVCREYQRSKCSRPDTECKFAHPPSSVEIQNGRVVACYDSIKGRCQREKPPCKYFHPPQHLKDQLLITGRNHLALKNALMGQMPIQTVLAGQMPMVASPVTLSSAVPSLLNAYARPSLVQQIANQDQGSAVAASLLNGSSTGTAASAACSPGHYAALSSSEHHSLPALKASSKQVKRVLYRATISPYFTNLPTVATASSAYGSYPAPMMPGHVMSTDQLNYGMMQPPQMVATQKSLPRTDRLEVCREYQRGACKRPEGECRFAHPPLHVQPDAGDGLVTVCMDFVKGRCSREGCRYFHPPSHLQTQLKQASSNAGPMPCQVPGQGAQAHQAAAAAGQHHLQAQLRNHHASAAAAAAAAGRFPEPYFLCLHK